MKAFLQSQEDWRVFHVYSDAGYSGATLERPALKRLLADVQARKIDIVLVYKIDRLTRSPKDFYQLIESFDRSGVDFLSITERFDTSTPAGRLLRNIMLTFAQFERELTSERTKDKMLERAKKGMSNGGYTPYGYLRRAKKLIPHPTEQKEVVSMFEMYLETRSLSAVYELLKTKEVKNKNNRSFSKTSIAAILRNVIYAGKVKHNTETYPGLHEPLVSEELFSLAQEAHQNRVRKFRVYKHFLFGGLIDCAECGSKMTPCYTNKHKSGKLHRYYYYRCTSTMKYDKSACSVKQVSAERLEQYCLEHLERISIDQNYVDNLVFRLNNDINLPQGSGYELKEGCSRFSSSDIVTTLLSFLHPLKTKRGLERNLIAKKSLHSISYSPKTISLSFVFPHQKTSSCPKETQTPRLAGLMTQTQMKEFGPLGMAPRLGFEPRYPAPEAGVLPLDDLGMGSNCGQIVSDVSLTVKRFNTHLAPLKGLKYE